MEPTFLNPQEVLNHLELEGDMVAADFGSGSGGWAIPLAKRLKFGKVYAIDISTGKEKWIFFAEGPVRFSPTIWNNRIYFGSDDGFVYC